MPSKPALISATVIQDRTFYNQVKFGPQNANQRGNVTINTMSVNTFLESGLPKQYRRLLIHADMWHGTLTCEGLTQDYSFKSLDACRAFATKNGYKGIWVRFGVTKYQVSIMIRKFRHQDKILEKSGLSRKEIAGVRSAQRRREKGWDTL